MRFWRGVSGGRGLGVVVAAACATAGAALPAAAHAGWDPPEPVDLTQNHSRSFIAPGGPGYVIGFPQSTPNGVAARIAARPIGGVLGLPMPLPDIAGVAWDGDMEFDAAGNALIANTYPGGRGYITYRGADGLGGPTEAMPPGYYPTAVSVAPTGEAMIGLNTSNSGVVKVAFRPAGKNAAVDLAGAETFSAHGALIGLQLQANGGAIVVWKDAVTGTFWQSVRLSTKPDFDPPVPIDDPRPDQRSQTPVLVGNASGYAILSWYGYSGSTGPSDEAVATVRSPDGTFPPAQVIGTGDNIVNVYPGITATGDGIATWNQTNGKTGCTTSSAYGSIEHGGAWGAAAPIGPSAAPLTNIPGAQPVSGTNDIAVALIEVQDSGTPCSYGDDQRGLFVHHFRAGPSGLADQGISTVSPLQAKNDKTTSYPQWSDIDMEPGGKIFARYQVDAARYLVSFDGVPPGPGGVADPGTTPTQPPTPPLEVPAPVVPRVPPAQSQGPIRAISAHTYVTLAPVDPNLRTISMGCSFDDVASGDCSAKLFAYYLFTGKPKETAGKKTAVRAAAPAKTLAVIASASATIPSGKTKQVKLTFNKVGKALIAKGKKVTITLQITITRGGLSSTERVQTTIKALKKKPRK